MMDEVTSMGIPGLDELFGGGLPKGFTVLVCGSPGSGMELFAKQFASAGIGKEDVVYFSTNERDEDVLKTMKRFGWKTDLKIVNIGTKYYEQVLARKLEISKYREEGLSILDIKRYKEEQTKSVNFLTSLTYEISKLKPPFRLIIDSLDFFLEYYDHGNVLSALRTIKAHTQHNEGVALVTMLKDVHKLRTQSGVEEIVDGIIELERQREKLEFKHYLLMRKVRNRPEKTGIQEYKITESGITPKLG